MDLKLTGKVALITGSSRGIGLATAKAFAAEGCRLMLSARSAEQLAEANRRLHGAQNEILRSKTIITVGEMAAGIHPLTLMPSTRATTRRSTTGAPPAVR